MKPITIEFNVTNQDETFREDSVTFDTVEELFDYVSPGGDCEHMPANLNEVQMIFLPPSHPNTFNSIADLRVTLQMGIVFLTGPLSTIVQVAQEIIDKVGRGELSEGFLAIIGAENK